MEYCCCFVVVLEGWGFYSCFFVSDQLSFKVKYPMQQCCDTEQV